MKTKTIYITEDGNEFNDSDLAMKHEQKLRTRKKCDNCWGVGA